MPLTVPEQTMWVVLQAIQKTAGPQTAALLTQAGLARFLTRPPAPTSFDPVATQEELIALYQQIYAMLGEDLTRLFNRNYGEITVEGVLQLPQMQALRAEGRRVPPDQQIRWFADTMAAWLGRVWVRQIVTEDDQACYLAQEVCYICYGITGVKRPLCVGGEVINQRLAQDFLGRRVRVVEVECAAMGAPHCKYALYK